MEDSITKKLRINLGSICKPQKSQMVSSDYSTSTANNSASYNVIITPPTTFTPVLKARTNLHQKFRHLSINKSDSPTSQTPSPTEYYTIPVPTDAPPMEQRIVNFLKMEGVFISHPSDKKKASIHSLKFNKFYELTQMDKGDNLFVKSMTKLQKFCVTESPKLLPKKEMEK